MRGLYEPVHWAGAGRRVMSGGECGPLCAGRLGQARGGAGVPGMVGGTNFQGRDPAEEHFLLSV